MLLWCSISVTTISSPGPSANFSAPGKLVAFEKEYASRFSASVMLRVKMISSRDGAFRNAATLSRAPS